MVRDHGRTTRTKAQHRRSTKFRKPLVEDDPTAREIITTVLRDEGYAVDSVATACVAHTCMTSIAYAGAIADWFLPEGNGGDVAHVAMSAGAKTLIISDADLEFSDGTKPRHQLLSKRLGRGALLNVVRRAISSK
jgi:CheY-like chemotaxis protein